MERRHFLYGGAALALPSSAWAQAPRRYRVAWRSFATGEPSSFLDPLREGFQDHGYLEGRNLVLESQ